MAERHGAGRLAPVAIIVAAWAAFWWPVLAGDDVLFARDLVQFAIPAKHVIVEAFSRGALPLWTPYMSGGMPFLADLSNQALYPPNLLLLLWSDLDVGVSRFVVLHTLLAALGFVALARALGVMRAIAIPAALLYASSGYVLSIIDNVNYLPVVGWAPLGLALFTRGLDTGSGRHTAGAALCLAMIVLAGDTLNAPLFGAAALLLALFHPRRCGDTRAGRTFHLAAVGVLAAGLAAIQILPALELLAVSVRESGLPLAERLVWSLPPWRTLELAMPFPFGTRYPDVEFLGADLYPERDAPWADSLYVGLVTVGLAIAAAALALRAAAPWWVMTLGALLLAYGRHTPMFELLSTHVPLLDSHRYPEKIAFWATLALAVLGALGAQALWARLTDAAPTAGATALRRLLASAVVLVVLILGASAPVRFHLGERAAVESGYWSGRLGFEVTHYDGLIWHAAVLGAVLLLICWLPRRWWPRAAAGLMWVSLADVAWVHVNHVPRMPVALASAEPPPWLREHVLSHGGIRVWFDPGPRGDDVYVTDNPLLRETLASLAGDASADSRPHFIAYASRYQQARLVPNTGVAHGVRYLNSEWSPLRPQAHVDLRASLFAHDGAAALARSGVSVVLSGLRHRLVELDAEGFEPVAEVPAMDLRIVKVVDPVARARVVPNARAAPAHDAGGPDPSILARPDRVLLESTGTGPLALPPEQPVRAGGAAELVTVAPERLRVRVDSPYRHAFVVLDESYFPGWTASVDGTLAPVHLADRRFLAVPVPPGESRVDLVYRSTHLSRGVAITLVAILLTAWVAPRPGRDRRSKAA